MKRPGWIAIFLAIIFPSTALIVVLLSQHSRNQRVSEGPGRRGGPPFEGKFGKPPGHGPMGPMSHEPPGLFHPDSQLKTMARELSLSAEQVEKIKAIERISREKEARHVAVMTKMEKRLNELLSADPVDRPACARLLEEFAAERAKVDILRIFRPLDIRAVLTEKQRKLVEGRLGGPLGSMGIRPDSMMGPPHLPPGDFGGPPPPNGL